MNRNTFQLAWPRRLFAAVMTGISGAVPVPNAGDAPLASTNAPSIAVDALVAEERQQQGFDFNAVQTAKTGEGKQ